MIFRPSTDAIVFSVNPLLHVAVRTRCLECFGFDIKTQATYIRGLPAFFYLASRFLLVTLTVLDFNVRRIVHFFENNLDYET